MMEWGASGRNKSRGRQKLNKEEKENKSDQESKRKGRKIKKKANNRQQDY